MTDISQLTTEQLQALLAATQGKQPSAPVLGGWSQPVAPPTGLNIQGVSIPVSVQSSKGKVRVQIILGAEVGQSPAVLQQAIEQMISMGVDVDAWQSQSSGGGGNWGTRNGGGGNWGNRNDGGGNWGNRNGGGGWGNK